ncbi:MAG: T9SS type A sorting domain-containing protein [Cytophagales bacterium]|nr:T9SS type A sorting domain-containing protein [Cytophagales bacterium]
MKIFSSSLLLLLTSTCAFAQCPPSWVGVQNVTTGTCQPGANITKQDDGLLTIDADAILDMEGNNLTIRGPVTINGTLSISGTLTIGRSGVVIVASGGSISAGYIRTGGDGSLDIRAGAVVTATSFLNDFAGPAINSVNINGTLTVTPGAFTNASDGYITGSGTFNADVTDNGDSIFGGTYSGTCTGTCPSVLPVVLIDFTASQKSNEVELLWSTASELNNDYFSIERSLDGLTFYSIGTLSGVGTSNQVTNYSFQDKSPLQGMSFYRLKQIDFDGEFEHFNTKSVLFETLGNPYSVYPNPTFDVLTIEGYLGKSENIKLMSLEGQNLTNLVEYRTDASLVLVNLRNLPVGIYLLRIDDKIQKISKQ